MERNEAIEVIKRNYPHVTESDSQFETALRLLIPELAGSEDGRIREVILKALMADEAINILVESGIYYEDVESWLKKQGEHAKFCDSIQVGDKVTRNQDGVLVNLSQLERVAKPADKVEPKFKVGDWVISPTGVCWHIDRIENNRYEVSSTDGVCADWSSNTSLYRLWTIQDAKDGDVLSFNDDHGNDSIELIKSITGKKIEFWFCLTNGDSYEVFDGITPYTNLVSRKDATPATKGQRDLLFQKMHEAGYEWDAEKKELKKIVQKSFARYKVGDTIYYDSFGRLVSFVIANIVENGTDDPMYEDKDGNSVFQNDIIEQKPAWSEEDEDMCYKATAVINRLCAEGKEYVWSVKTLKKLFYWLKSLKERVQPQNTWKPSEEMLEALYRAVPENVKEMSEDEMLLDKLYQGLKYGRVLSAL